MEYKVKSSSSSSSFTTQLFGPKEPSSSSNFNSIFPPPSKGTARNILSSKHGSLDERKESATCNLSSSLYYGGQDVYSGSTSNHTYPTVSHNLSVLTRHSPEETMTLVETTRRTHPEETGGKAYSLTYRFLF
ncbi:hypothetical protein EUTSA_v10010907mg [Eutrema salsugineum]|uniref:Uncharacterized protein n=1 Tax=Eutrema salsugineum TaxID=72664 RepID=V4LTR2_EUTSA|nr:hypothetical protein EUTSA_v10010907mg [Eutrema salsugineum]